MKKIIFLVLLINSVHIHSQLQSPNNPMPNNNATNVSLFGNISFTAGDAINATADMSYRIYFDSNSNPTTVYTNALLSSFDFIFGFTTIEFSYDSLLENTNYYWKVEVLDASENVLITSPIWTFTTITLSGTGVFNGDAVLETQAEVDNFNFTEVTGQLIITESSSGAITNLNGLMALTTVGNGISIDGNSNLTSLNGLNNLSNIQGSFDAFGEGIGLNISDNNSLELISALSSIISLEGNITIKNNDSLITLNGLEGITILNGNLSITNNTQLTSLNGLHNITEINGVGLFGGGFGIQSNDSLSTLNGLNSLVTINGSLGIIGNNSLTSLAGLETLINIIGTGKLSINENNLLTSLNGLDNLINLNGNLTINHNDSLIILGLPNIQVIGGSLVVTFNDSLLSLNGLDNLKEITRSLLIRSNYNLTSLDGLDNLVNIGGNLVIGNVVSNFFIYPGNIALTSISSLSNLASIGEVDNSGAALRITGCSSLTSLDGLENLNTIQQGRNQSEYNKLEIGSNFADTSFAPLNNLYNPLLTDFCALQYLISLEEFTPESEIIIANNATNPTISEIENLNCTLPPATQTAFKWRTATDNGNSITETVNNISVTFMGDNATILNYSDSVTDNFNPGAFDNIISADVTSDVTFSFNETVDVVSIYTHNTNSLTEHTFTPIGGNNNSVTVSRIISGKVMLNWEGVTSFTVSTNNPTFSFDDLRVYGNSVLSINDYLEDSINIYPNPTTDYINIETNEPILKADVYSLQGQKIETILYNNTLNLNKLNDGVYFINIYTEKGAVTKKIIKH